MDYSNLTKPFQGSIIFWEELTYSSGSASEGTGHRISDIVNDVRLDSGDIHKSLRGIDSATVACWISQPSDYTLHVEWVSQCTLYSLSTLCIDRSCGILKSVFFDIGVNTCSAVSDTYYRVDGCIAKNWNISGSRGNEYICTADFSVHSVATSEDATMLHNLVLSGSCTSFAVFNVAGSITPSSGIKAYITDSIDITVENNLTDCWDSDSILKAYAIPGAKDITGSSDISLEDGGGNRWGSVLERDPISTITIDLGCVELNTITLSNVEYDSISVDINTSGDMMMTSIPFTAKTIAIS